MNQGLIPRRYAKALYEVALERNCTAPLYGHMLALGEAFGNSPELAKAVGNPFVSEADKDKLICTAAGVKPGDKDAATFNDFVKLLVQNHRIDLMREMAIAYVGIYREKNHICRVEITSAAPLRPEAKDRLEKLISAHLNGGKLELHEKVDPSLIGGFVVDINNERLDASIKNELEQLRLKLLK